MTKLLHIDSSPMGETSVSREFSKYFVERRLMKDPDATILRDLTFTKSLAPLTRA